MSQKKVDEYKKSKANRRQIMKRERLIVRLEAAAAVLVLAALIGWFSFAVYQNSRAAAKEAHVKTTSLDMSAVEKYLSDLQGSGEGETAAETTEGAETVVSSSLE